MAEGTEVGTGYVSIVPSAAGFGAKLQSQITGEAGRAGTQAGQALGTGMATSASGIVKGVGGVLAAAGTWKFLHGAVREAEDAVRVGRLTEAVIKSTGGAAGVTAGQVEKLAGSLSKVAAVDDEVIQSAANVLLTFTRVKDQVGAGNDVFSRATAAALDMSAALGGDLQGSVLQLGKALNDPVAGMTALTRSGVSFTAQQKDQIKALAESGDLLATQKIILGEVNTQFGGAAAAGATSLAKLNVTVGNLQETLGTALLPAVNAAAGGLTVLLGGITALPAPIQTATVAFAGLGAGAVAIGLIAPKIAAAREQLEGMGAAGTFASRSLGVLGKVGAGLVIAGAVMETADAIGAAITRIAAGPVAPANALTKGLVELGTSGKVTGEVANQLGDDLGQLGEKASEANTTGLAALGTTLAGVLNPSLRDSKRDIDSIDKALAGLVSGGNADVAAKALDLLTKSIAAGPGGQGAADKFVAGLGDYEEALNGVDVQALLTGTSLDTTGDAAADAGDKAKEAAAKWDDLHGNLEDLVASDWSKDLASNFASALNPLEKFTFSGDKDIAGLKTQVASAKTDLEKANADLAKLQVTGTAADIARIRGQAGDIDGARAAVDSATRKFNDTKALLAEAQKSPLGSIGENLQSNLGGLTSWLDNYEKVATGGHESLANHLVSLGPQAADALAEAVGASPKQLDKLQTTWDKADAKVTEILSGQFELNVAQASRPGETLAEIIAARYEESIVPKLTQATLRALQIATDALLGGGRTPFLEGYFSGDVPGLPPPPLAPAPPLGAGPVAAAPVAAPLPGTITFEGGIHVTTATDADPHQIANETADYIAWRLAPKPTMVG
jgi:hypothetical protein